MKLLFYIDCMGLGGAQRVMNNLMTHYVSMGAEVLLVNDNIHKDSYIEYPVNEKVRRVYLVHSESAVSNIERIKTLRNIIKQEKPDTALSFLGPPNYRMLAAAIGLKCKKVVSVRNDPYREYGAGIKKFFANVIFCLADGVVFQTKDASNYFNDIVKRKSKIIYNPVNEEIYKHRWHDGEGGIVCVGRLQPQKNPMLLLKAFEQVSNKYKDITLHYYGDGEMKEQLAAYIENASLTDRVYLEGQSLDVPSVLEDAKIYVLCSDYEGMPNALLEAMAVGVPSISTDCPCGGPREIIEDGINGFLVPCNDVERLATAIENVLKSVELRSMLSLEGNKRAADFKPEVIFSQWDKALL